MTRLVPVLLLLSACRVTVEPRVEPPTHNPSEDYEELLFDVVNDHGQVDFAELEAKREPLDRYVAWLSAGTLPRGSQKRYAWWLNAYNALVLYQILEEGRPDSVLDVPAKGLWLGSTPFYGQRQFLLGPEAMSLDEIFGERLRLYRQDLKLHAAAHHGYRTGPPLRQQLYEGDKLTYQLHDQMRRWISDPTRGVRVEDGVAYFNPIFERYARDFDMWTAGDDWCTTAARHAREPLRSELITLAVRGCPHEVYEDDWSLNDAPRGERIRHEPEPLPEGTEGDTGDPEMGGY